MQLHIHTGMDTRIGKSLSAILTMRAVYNRRVLLLDIDHFGSKLHSLLNSLSDPRCVGGPYEVYRIKTTNIYVASIPSLDDLLSLFRVVSTAVTEISDWILTSDRTFTFEYLVADTGHSIISYRAMETPLSLPKDTTRVKFWINYDYPQYTNNHTPKSYWESYDWIKANHSNTAFPINNGWANDPFIHVFSPLSFITEATETYGPISRWLMDAFHIPRFRRLVDAKHTTANWLDPDNIVHRPDIVSHVPSFDVWLKQQTEKSGYNFDIGSNVARYWLDQNRFQLGKPTNVIFVPYDPDLEGYRNKWTQHPLRDLADMWSRMPIVTHCDALRNQWHHLAVTP